MNIQKKAFTLVELIVSVMIVVILSSIGFYSYVGFLGDSRDTQRKASMGEIKSALKVYKQKRGAYPFPGNYFYIVNNTVQVAFQGKLNDKVSLSTMENIPLDPYTKSNYFYSVTPNKQEYQIALSLENGDFPIALLEGTYKTVSINKLPSIALAGDSSDGTSVEITDSTNRNTFILNGGENLPYSFIKPYSPYYAGVDIDTVLASGDIDLWQNSDYRNCDEIKEADKMIHTTGSEEYQIVTNTGLIINTTCTLP